jgi:hypothetical protein
MANTSVDIIPFRHQISSNLLSLLHGKEERYNSKRKPVRIEGITKGTIGSKAEACTNAYPFET